MSSRAMMMIARTIAIFSAAMLAASTVRADFEPNDTFETRAILDPDITSVSNSLYPSIVGEGPDTTLGAFYAAGGLIQVDDDSSPLGDGTASGLFDITVNSDGSIRLKVSGCADFDFDGNDDVYGDPHEQAGAYDLHVRVYNSSHQQVDCAVLGDTLVAGAVDARNLFGYPSDGTFDAYIDNTPGGAEDPIDFMTFTGLPVGEAFEAEITSAGFDTMLGWFDDSGALIDYDDDGGEGELLSMISGEVPVGGALNLAATGYPDSTFDGFHAQEGDYTLAVRILPIPGDTQPDGVVDGGDYTIWADNYGNSPVPPWSEGGWVVANFNEDNGVDGADYTIWADHYGQSHGGHSVPEPGGVVLLAVGVAAALSRKKTAR